MDIGSAFTFVFDDEDWIKKVAIGGGIAVAAFILSFIIVGILLFLPLNGYVIRTIQNVRDGKEKPLPEWADFGDLFKTGFSAVVIAIVYYLPAILLSCASALTRLLPTMTDIDPDMAGTLFAVAACISCFQIIINLLAAAIIPAAWIRFAQYETIGSGFQFAEIFRFIKENIGDYVIAILLALVATFISYFGLILCFIGVFFTFFWSMLVKANLFGQLARKAQGAV